MFIIAGLGNPGSKYEATRHNIGFDVIDILSRRCGIGVESPRSRALTGTGIIEGGKVMLVKPQTFMNLSGDAVRDILAYYKEDPGKSLIIISDDVDLPVGHLRIRKSGSPGGHNGLKDVVNKIGTQQFIRVRIGVGQKPADWDLADYVLSRFVPADRKKIDEAEEAAAEAVLTIVRDGPDKAMNRFNSFLPEDERLEAERLAELKREAARKAAQEVVREAAQEATREPAEPTNKNDQKPAGITE